MFLLQTLNLASCFQPCSAVLPSQIPCVSYSKPFQGSTPKLACFFSHSFLLPSLPCRQAAFTVLSLISMLLSFLCLLASKIEFFSLTISPFSCSHRFMHFKFLYCEILHRSGDERRCSICGFLSQHIIFVYSLTFYLLKNNMTPGPCLQLALDP